MGETSEGEHPTGFSDGCDGGFLSYRSGTARCPPPSEAAGAFRRHRAPCKRRLGYVGWLDVEPTGPPIG